MVKKLYKHELLAWLRVLTIIFGIVLGVSVMHRIIQFFENDSMYYSIVNGSVSFMYMIALLVCSVAPLVSDFEDDFSREKITMLGYKVLAEFGSMEEVNADIAKKRLTDAEVEVLLHDIPGELG